MITSINAWSRQGNPPVLLYDSIRASGGFVLKSGVEVNSTLEIIFEMIKPVCESEVVKILFS